MKKFINVLILIFILLIPVVKAQVTQLALGNNNYVFENAKWMVIDSRTSHKYEVNTNLITVKLYESASLTSLLQAITNSGITLKNQNGLGFIRLNIPINLSFSNAYNILSNTNLCSSIEVNTYAEECLTRIPNDQYFPNQYYLKQTSDWDINAPEAWWWETGANSVIVAVVDEGVHYYHPDLEDNMSLLSWDFVDGDPNPTNESNTHGTLVAGIIGAKTNNSIGVAGIAGGWGDVEPACKIMGLRTDLEDDLIIDAIEYAANNGAKIINMSFNAFESIAMTSVIEYAYRFKGCLLVAASGNDGGPIVLYPANHSDVMAVGGTFNDSRNWGNFGTELEITAPAAWIMSTEGLSGYSDAYSGTSFSTPMVCGGAALLWSYNSNLINMDVRSLLKQTAYRTFSGYDEEHYGKGLLRLDQALGPVVDPPYLLPLAPTNVALTGAVGQHPTISWTKVDVADHYNVYRSVDLDGIYHFQKVGEVVHNPNQNTHYWVDNSVIIADKFNTTSRHYYRITTVDSNPYESITSTQVSTNSNWAEKMFSGDFNGLIEYKLYNAFPNPFNPTTTISYSIKEAGMVNLEVFNILGQKVSVLVNEFQEAGINSVTFDASTLSNGVYLYQLQSGNHFITKKMILAK